MTTTQFAQASYQEVIDLHTESGTASVIGLHTPRGDSPYNLLHGFFEQFKKFKYNGCRFSLVPASRLPADPLQVSYEAGEPTIDPRDMLNPIMFHGCHGNDMGTILNTLYSQGVGGIFPRSQTPSIEQNILRTEEGYEGTNLEAPSVDDLYYSALVDKTWLKAHPQAGIRKSGLRPMVYSVASNTPFYMATRKGTLSPGDQAYIPGGGSQLKGDGVLGPQLSSDDTISNSGEYMKVGSQPMVPAVGLAEDGFRYVPQFGTAGINFTTPRLQSLGWLDTMSKSVITKSSTEYTSDQIEELFSNSAMARAPTRLPLVYMGMLMLPPAYKTEQYYRLIIDHQFSFKQFRGISGGEYSEMSTNTYYNFNE